MISIEDIKKLDKKPALRWLFVKMLGIQEGVLSNYPICCIAWYLMREDTVIPFSIKHGQTWEQIWEWYCRRYFDNKIQHIQCPYHRKTQKNPQYFKCSKCDWSQLEKKECLNCLVGREAQR